MSLASARQAAKRLNCRRLLRGIFPDEICDHCIAISAGRHIDVIEFEMDVNTDLEEMFSLDDDPAISGYGKYRVYIVTNAAPSAEERQSIVDAAASMDGIYNRLLFAADTPG